MSDGGRPVGFWGNVGVVLQHIGTHLDPNMLALLIGLGVLDGLLASAITHFITLSHETQTQLIATCFQGARNAAAANR